MNVYVVARYLSKVLSILSIFMLVPLTIALVDMEKPSILGFVLAIALSWVVIFLLKLVKKDDKAVYIKDGFMTVGVCWIALSVFGGLPFWISGEIPSFINALFESTSGFTTTGSTMVLDVESMHTSMLLWRSFTHWIGGMGVLVFIMALIPNITTAGERSVYVMRAESPGPNPGKLVPKLQQSAIILYGIYLALTILEVILLAAGGMPLFDSICNSMSTAGTGGFAVRNASIGAYESSYAEIVIGIFMFLFGINFNIFYFLLIRNFSGILRNSEFKAYFGIMASAVILITINISGLYSSLGESARHAFFHVSSVMTTTGFSATDINIWPTFSKTMLLILMFIGASAGSTAGGIKVSRIVILFREAKRALFQIAHPRSVDNVKLDGKVVDKTMVHAVNGFFITYMFLFFVSFLIVSWEGDEFASTISNVAACFNNIGLSFGSTGPATSYTEYSILSKSVLILDMLLGRLELYPILLLLSPRTWKRI